MKQLARIWLAEDNEADVRLMREAFSEHDIQCQLQVCVDGEEALRLIETAEAEQYCPDLVILDFHLPKVDGLEVLQRFRANPSCVETPIVIFTSGLSPEERSMIEGYRNIFILQKPVNLDDYLAVGRQIKDWLLKEKAF